MIYNDGKIYIGYSSNNKKNGFGIFIWKNKMKAYIGFWKDNNQHGLGKFLKLKGSKYGLWSKGLREKTFDTEDEFYDELERKNEEQFKHYFKYGYKAIEMYIQFFKMV